MLFTGEAPQVLALPPLQSDPLSHHLGRSAPRGRERAHGAAARGGGSIPGARPGAARRRAVLRGGRARAAAVRRAPAGARAALLRPVRRAAPGRRRRAPRVPVPRAGRPARGRGRARGGLCRRPVEGSLAGVFGRRRLAADAPALGAGAAAVRSTCPRSWGRWPARACRSASLAGDLGAGRRAAPALRLRQPHPPVRGRRAREGPDPGGGGAGRRGGRRGARASSPAEGAPR